MSTATAVPHIHLDREGRAWVDDTNVKVIEVALDHIAYGWGAETIHENHPNFSLAQVYAALAWYYDHQVEMNAEIEAQEERLKVLRHSAKTMPSEAAPQTMAVQPDSDTRPPFGSGASTVEIGGSCWAR